MALARRVVRQAPQAISNAQSKVAFCKRMVGTALQVSLKALSQLQGRECGVELDSPRLVFGRRQALARIVLSEAFLQVNSVTAIILVCVNDTLENVGVEHLLGLAPIAENSKLKAILRI